jgi:glycosyl hydrolase family 25/putative peptidoglycan binding protein
MTFYYPDVADNGESGLILEPHTIAVCAKASEGRTFTDPSYTHFRDQASAVGAFFIAYHWLWPGNEQAQAEHCFSIVGKDTPLMLDVENINGNNTVSGITEFTHWYRSLGGHVSLLYLPRWYWSTHMGAPALPSYDYNGLLLVASDYSHPYSDTVPGWDSYGGINPYVLQYTDALQYGGRHVDFNACQDDFASFITKVGGTPAPVPPPPVPGVHKPGSRLLSYRVPNLTGDDVLFVQKFIGPKRSGPADGVFGPLTRSGVFWYQNMRGITADGIVGPQTFANMGVTWVGHDY